MSISAAALRKCKVCRSSAQEWQPYLLCDDHLREYIREIRSRRRDKDAELARKRYAANPARQKAASKAWADEHKVRMSLVTGAAGYVRWAVAVGLLQKSDGCQRCGRLNCFIEAAHADYNYPLEVEWLCRPCHRLWDRNTPKTMPELGMRVYS